MARYNAHNELIKTKFFGMLENAKGRDPKTVDSYVKSIHEFEVYSKFIDFKKFDIHAIQWCDAAPGPSQIPRYSAASATDNSCH